MAAISSAREGVREKFSEEMSLEPGHSCKITPIYSLLKQMAEYES